MKKNENENVVFFFRPIGNEYCCYDEEKKINKEKKMAQSFIFVYWLSHFIARKMTQIASYKP